MHSGPKEHLALKTPAKPVNLMSFLAKLSLFLNCNAWSSTLRMKNEEIYVSLKGFFDPRPGPRLRCKGGRGCDGYATIERFLLQAYELPWFKFSSNVHFRFE